MSITIQQYKSHARDAVAVCTVDLQFILIQFLTGTAG